MENLIIKENTASIFLPEVNFNAETGILEIRGESYMENPLQFYAPITKWIKDFIKHTKNKIVFNVKLTYFNSSSSKSILEILKLLKIYLDKKGELEINWYFKKNDIEMDETVEDYVIVADLLINSYEL